MPVVDSKQQMLEVPEIVKISLEETNTPVDFDLAYSSIVKEFQDPNGTFLRYGNTIFIIHGSEKTPGAGMFRAINADTAQNFLESSRKFVVAAHRKGYFLLVTQFKDPSLLNLFRMVMKQPPNPGMGYTAQKTGSGQFRVTLNLGPKTNDETAPPDMQMQDMQSGMKPQQSIQPLSRQPQGALQQMPAPANMMGGVK